MTIDEPVETWTGGATGVDAFTASGSTFYAFPNPTADVVHFAGVVPEQIDVYDGMGRFVATWTREAIAAGISLHLWPAGTYHCQDPMTGRRSLLILQP